jgi:hypothetical protein
VAKNRGLDDWFGKENWVDISAPKEGGGYEKCGRKSAKDSDRGYPKCVPAAKAAKMSKKEVASAVRRKRAKKQGVGGRPTNVKTFAAEGGSIMDTKPKEIKTLETIIDRDVPYEKRAEMKKMLKKLMQESGSSKGAVSDKELKAMKDAVKGSGVAGGGVKSAAKALKPQKKSGGGYMKAKGKALGGAMMMRAKGKAAGGAMKSKAKSSPVRSPSRKNSGLYGR